MTTLTDLYRPALGLLTDLYQLTMAYGYWKLGLAEHEAAFHLFFRKNPFGGGFALAAGLAQAVQLLAAWRFAPEDLEYLAGLRGNDDQPLFEPGFLDYLGQARFCCDVDAVPEGTAVFAPEPLVRIQGPLLQCQLVETPLLTLLNFQTLIATKAARIRLAAGEQQILEFGLRRAQGFDGGLTASRAAYLGGCDATSNVLAGRLYGIPVRGTHAHSWVMCFADEPSAFAAYAQALPNNCVFLVDTYDTLQGVRHAVEVGQQLRAAGHRLVGIRLDSGDLAYLSQQARQILDDGGFPDARILASNDLDERLIESLHHQDARIDVWGVGTKLVTAYDQPALGGVYKLAAIRAPGGAWDYRLKLSEQAIKTSDPGRLQVRRFRNEHGLVADALYDLDLGLPDSPIIVDPLDPTRRRTLEPELDQEELLVPLFRKGQLVAPLPTLEDSRQRARAQLALLHPGFKRFDNPHKYPVGLELRLYELKTRLVLAARGVDSLERI